MSPPDSFSRRGEAPPPTPRALLILRLQILHATPDAPAEPRLHALRFEVGRDEGRDTVQVSEIASPPARHVRYVAVPSGRACFAEPLFKPQLDDERLHVRLRQRSAAL